MIYTLIGLYKFNYWLGIAWWNLLEVFRACAFFQHASQLVSSWHQYVVAENVCMSVVFELR